MDARAERPALGRLRRAGLRVPRRRRRRHRVGPGCLCGGCGHDPDCARGPAPLGHAGARMRPLIIAAAIATLAQTHDAPERFTAMAVNMGSPGLADDLHYSRKFSLPDGGERVILATDRYIGFWEASNRPRSIDYPFTVIELHIGPDGVGEGKMSIATKIDVDKEHRTIVLENYQTQPVLLQSVRREPS